MKKKFTILVILFVAVMGLAAWWVLRSDEPSYKGKSLSYWIDPWNRGGHETEAERYAALAAMRDTAIPYLTKQLHWKPSSIMQKLYKQFPDFPPFVSYIQGGSDPRGAAAHALGEFGPFATNAVPDLAFASTNHDLGSSWYQQMCARAALIKIKRESLDPYIEKLKDTSINGFASLEQWYQNALMIGEFGTNAAAAVPNLISALGPTNNPVIQAHALIALGEIHSRPETSVPAIVPFLKSSDVALRQKAVFALTGFRDAAKSAKGDLTQCLDDPDPWTRISAANALKAIDSTGAAKGAK